jgi:hypothetical protein
MRIESIESIEILLVGVIVLIQIWVFGRTYLQIRLFKRIIPEIISLRIDKLRIPHSELQDLAPTVVLANVNKYKAVQPVKPTGPVEDLDDGEPGRETAHEEPAECQSDNLAEVSIIGTLDKSNHVFESILNSINNYLIRNRGAASDFNIIKDIVERNASSIEEDIHLAIAVPLYLGLMGTMLGIVIGLFSMPSLVTSVVEAHVKDVLLNDGISSLIGGVKIAMIASFMGLLLTIVNSGLFFRSSRTLIEIRKNAFYTFVQIELLPIINQGLASTLDSLQRNLFKFNAEFVSNLGQLSGIFQSNANAIRAQKELLDAIDKTKVAEMTRYNVKVLQQLDVSVAQFEKFNSYLSNVNELVDNSQRIVGKTNELLERTDNFKTIADNIENRLVQSQLLLDFLSQHFKMLEEHKEFTVNAVADVGHAVSDSFKNLGDHIQSASNNIKTFTIDELEALKKALSESKTNLSNLEHLATLHKDVAQFKDNSSAQGDKLNHQLELLNQGVTKSIAIIEEIERAYTRTLGAKLAAPFKKLFKGGK